MTGPLTDLEQAREAGILLPYQKAWVEDPATVKVCQKSRRTGFSWCEASDDALYAAMEKGSDVWYVGYNKDMAIEFIGDAGHWAKHYNLAASAIEEEVIQDEDKDILTYKITFASGHRVTALSSRPTNLRGKQGRVILDEAAFHDDLPGLIKAAIALTMWGGQVRIISTHNGVDNPFNELIEDIRAGKKPYALHTVTLDDALGQGLYRRICQVLNRVWSPEAELAWREELVKLYGDDANEELFCIPSQGGGVYLSRAIIEQCMNPAIPVLRLSCPEGYATESDTIRQEETDVWIQENLAPLLALLNPHLKSFYGMDFGRTGDLSVIAPAQEDAQLVLRTPFLLEMRNTPFRQQEQVLFYLVDHLPVFMAGANDARGNGQFLAEVAMQRYGERIQQVMLSNEWYRDNMPRLKDGLEDKTLELPRDADVLKDLRLVIMDKGVAKVPDNKHTVGTDGGKRHGDAAIALALLEYAVTLDVCGMPEVYSTRVKRAFAQASAY